MMTQRTFAFLLIAQQAAALGYLTGTLAFPLTIASVAFLGVISQRRYACSRDQMLWLLIGLGVLFYFKYLVAPHDVRFQALFIRSRLALVIGQFLTVVQVAQFYLRRDDGHRKEGTLRTRQPGQLRHVFSSGSGAEGLSADRLPLWLPALGAVALVCFLDLRVTRGQRLATQILTIGFTLVTALYFSSCRIPLARAARKGQFGRRVAGGVVLALVAVAAWSSAAGMYRYEREIEAWIAEVFPTSFRTRSEAGFSRHAVLGSINERKFSDPNQVTLRIYAGRPPGYLRGKAYDRFKNGEWGIAAGRDFRYPIGEPPVETPLLAAKTSQRDLYTFALRRAASSDWRQLEIWPASSMGDAVFTPLSAAYLQLAIPNVGLALLNPKIKVDRHLIVRPTQMLTGLPYAVYVPAEGTRQSPPAPLAFKERQRLTRDVTGGDPRVRELATRLFASCETTSEKIASVRKYFRTHYAYHWGVTVPEDVFNPLSWFLLEKPAAHCEYFASGTVALLRLAGVPSRFVTGFVAGERNRSGGYWVARNKNAHAWAEAYDEREGWIIVDSTPPDGHPQPLHASRPRQIWEHLWHRVKTFRVQLQYGGLTWLIQATIEFLASRTVFYISIGVLTSWGLWRWYQWHSRPRLRRETRFRELHRLLSRMDSRLSRHHFWRQENETLSQFAGRIRAEASEQQELQAAAEWYELYASLRYGGDVDRQELDRLAQTLRMS